jgi:hypothetical protein
VSLSVSSMATEAKKWADYSSSESEAEDSQPRSTMNRASSQQPQRQTSTPASNPPKRSGGDYRNDRNDRGRYEDRRGGYDQQRRGGNQFHDDNRRIQGHVANKRDERDFHRRDENPAGRRGQHHEERRGSFERKGPRSASLAPLAPVVSSEPSKSVAEQIAELRAKDGVVVETKKPIDIAALNKQPEEMKASAEQRLKERREAEEREEAEKRKRLEEKLKNLGKK